MSNSTTVSIPVNRQPRTNSDEFSESTTEYNTCTGLLTQSSTLWPKTSIFEIVASGVSKNKLVIGKPATTVDAGSGYMDTSTLAGCVQTAVTDGWNGGVMVRYIRSYIDIYFADFGPFTGLAIPPCLCLVDLRCPRLCLPRNLRSHPQHHWWQLSLKRRPKRLGPTSFLSLFVSVIYRPISNSHCIRSLVLQDDHMSL